MRFPFQRGRNARGLATGPEDLFAGPIRGELLGAERLAERARVLARDQRIVHERRQVFVRRRPAKLLIRLAQSRKLLDDAHERLTAAALRGTDVGPAGDWLLDNYHLVREHAAQVRESLPEHYFRELPLLVGGPLAEYPRVYQIAITLISHTEGRVDLEGVERFVAAFQERERLSLGELWAVPAMLRLGLLESVRRMTLRTVQRLDEVEDADRWTARILHEAAEGPEAMRGALAAFVAEPHAFTPTFVSRVLQQLRASAGAVPPLVGVEQWFAEEGLGPTDAATRAAERLALTSLMMANSITSLRALAPLDWRSFVERQSEVEQVLREDPSADYLRMTFATRDAYRHAVERIARGAVATEVDVARRAVELSQGAPQETRRSHVGFWLVDRGVADLERAVGYAAPLGLHLHRWVLRHPNLVYVGGIAAGTIAALAPVYLAVGPAAHAAWLMVLPFAILPAFDIAVNVMSQLVTAFLPPRLLPKLDFPTAGIPADSRTAVVVPTIFATVEAVRESLSNLEVQFLANRDPHLHFALLSDVTDAPTEVCDADAAILGAAEEGITALNARYAPESHDAFFLFHRARRWNAQQGVWMGWERKRGKLAQFNQVLQGAPEDAFSSVVGDLAILRTVRYVITLDADTMLPPDEAAALVGAIAHPLNRARFDPVRSRVVEGYGILQPRVGVSLASAHRSRFATVHSGHPGVDPYTTAVSDVYQDLYGEGSFTGKGIYDVEAFETATHGRFPENTLLSHDLIEGNYARAGLVTDITVFDDYPARYLSHARRKHRWIRGDWQLFRWLTGTVPGPGGPEKNRLSLVGRWKILDNLRRSAVELAQLAFLLAGWTLLPGSPFVWTALGLLAIAAPWIFSLSLAAVAPATDKSLRAYYAAFLRDAITSAQQIGLAIAFLPHHAWLSADAIGRTIWRVLVSRRYLLEWQSAALTEQSSFAALGRFWRAMWPAAVLPLAVMVFAPLASWPVVAPLLLVWTVAPFVAFLLSRPAVVTHAPLDSDARATVLRYARAHWTFFDRYATADTAWLAPDNVQEDPARVVAMRTSPTNIGLQLLSTVSAHDLGFITADGMTARLERIFDSLDRAPRFRGHFLNWYALPELTVLEPGYVSTVDSGNLAGHLIAVRQACLALAEGTLAPRLMTIAERADRFVEEMDFGFLFDPTTKLFRIGFNTATHQLDHSSYDLLASEARLASFIAIAKGEVNTEHWFHLGRALTLAHGHAALVSWSGSMFEYLMPILVMRAFPTTLLGRTYEGALERQVRFGAERGVPWGVSESTYNVRDRHLTYQYRAFGVPDLALQRGLGRELVVAPYASGLAMMVDPPRALANLERLEGLGALGDCGFFDALDWTRPPVNGAFTLVRTLMAHHVGMSLVAFTNALLADRWQERFHTDPRVRAVALLLDERVPRRLEFQAPQLARAEESRSGIDQVLPSVREYDTADTPRPHVALLGHAPYTVMVTPAGGGYSRCDTLAVTRWRPDGTRDDTGQFCYLRDVESGRLWSSGHQPTGTLAESYHASLATDRVTLVRTDGPFETRTEIVVVPEDSAEVRRVTVTNHSGIEREVELTSYGEIVLAPRAADRLHPAFGNLFVETEWHEWCHALTATRRPRSADEPPLWCAHVVDTGTHRVGAVTFESDRARFLGRGRTTSAPAALVGDATLSRSTGAVLDPIFAIRTRVRLAPGQSESVSFTTLVASSRERIFALTDRYHGPHAAQRAMDLAWTSTQVELRELGITPADAAACQDLAGYVLFPDSVMRAPHQGRARRDGWQQTLWAHGISGDWPVVMATIDSADGLPSLQPLLTAHRYWRLRGVHVDLVVVSSEPQSYLQDLRARITDLLLSTGGSAVLDASGGVHLRNRAALGPEDFDTIAAVARLAIACDGRTIARIVADITRTSESTRDGVEDDGEEVPAEFHTLRHRAPAHAEPVPVAPRSERKLRFDNGIGGLTEGDTYRIRVQGNTLPPAPWANVIANERGGFIVTERGGGSTWAESSYFFRLSPWFNDPVSDPVGEALYLRDEGSGETWSATPAPVRSDLPYVVEHGAGFSEFTHERAGIATKLTLGMAGNDAVKLSVLEVTNHDSRDRRLTLTSYVEWTLGVLREQTQHRVRTRFDAKRSAILADNPFDPQFASWIAFSALSTPVLSHTGDRREFIGRNGSAADPAALRRQTLAGRTGLGVDPCAALQCSIELAPGETRTVIALLGAADDEAAALALLDRYRDATAARAALDATRHDWERRLGVITVRTPEPAFDALVNRWSLYQALACRMWARSAIYQSSGAFGFRDQLQDVMAFAYAEPEVARAHILRSAARQFVEGDVQHWWHPETGRGVRTRFSDDLVWLPYVVDHYVRVTGDRSVLDEQVPFLSMRALTAEEHEVYDLPLETAERASLFEHCVRALQRACTAGEHGLPLIGTGDWNDGMNRVGKDGRGESVWLGWFLTATLKAFAVHAEQRGEQTTADRYRARAESYRAAIETHGWDGAWYRRAFFDDGSPIGSAGAAECRIDSIAQSWAVISGAGAPDRQALAMRSLEEQLVDREARLIRLLTPPFDKTTRDPGYIKGYVPGVRENGAQYTHAALWAALAAALRGDGERAFEWFQMLNPFTHTDTPEGIDRYRVEPYVVAADVYTTPGAVGRGGWTWYTGSASWAYRVGLEALVGFQKVGDSLRISPSVPESWPELGITYRFGAAAYEITVTRPGEIRVKGARVTLDGVVLDGDVIPLRDDSIHHVVAIEPAG